MIQLIRDPVLEERQRAFLRGKFGMAIFFVSLSMLFGGVLAGIVVLRLGHHQWRSEGMPALPWELWVSTAVLAFGSWFLFKAQQAAAEDRPEEVYPAVRAATAFLVAFLVLQGWAWTAWWLSGVTLATRSLYSFSFFALTALHALHVLGGYGPLLAVLSSAKARRYRREEHAGLTYCAMYWHYLGVVWLVLFATLHLIS
ncbi:MAG: heme-copper oxidase subunit III [Phycisphaerales bacterium JB040]